MSPNFCFLVTSDQFSLKVVCVLLPGYSFLAAVENGADLKGSTLPLPPAATESELDPEAVLLFEASAFLSWSNCSPKSASSDNWPNILRSSKGFQLLGPGFELVPALERKGLVVSGGRL